MIKARNLNPGDTVRHKGYLETVAMIDPPDGFGVFVLFESSVSCNFAPDAELDTETAR